MLKKYYKPLYKKFVSLKANVQYKKRLDSLKFKKQKWQTLIFYLQRLQIRRKKKFRVFDLNKYYLPRFYNLFKQKYKTSLLNKKKFALFYGNLSSRYLIKTVRFTNLNKRKTLKKSLPINFFFLSILEKKLDVILYRAHFVKSIKNAHQLIIHKHIKVNNIVAKNKFYSLQEGDIIKINKKVHHLIYFNLIDSNIWPLPAKYLQVNYKIFEIIYTNNKSYQSISTQFPFWPDIFSLLRYTK